MNRTRYLPPGSMRRQRWLGRLEGSIGILVLVLAVGAALVVATPVELYRPAPATIWPAATGAPANLAAVDLPPCTGQGKDCADLDVVRTVPEPSTAALVAAGIAGLIWRAKT